MRASPSLPPDSLPQRPGPDAPFIRAAAPGPRRWWSRWRRPTVPAAPFPHGAAGGRPMAALPADEEVDAQSAAHRNYLQRLREAGL